MKKKIRLNRDNVSKIVREKLRRDGNIVSESKIDRAIKQYLRERNEGFDGDYTVEDNTAFSEETRDAFRDMIHGLSEMVEDLRIIQTKEPDVLVDMYPEEVYAEPFLENMVSTLESVIESIEHLRDLDDNINEE